MSIDLPLPDTRLLGLLVACSALIACSQIGRILIWVAPHDVQRWQPRLIAFAPGVLLADLGLQGSEALLHRHAFTQTTALSMLLAFAGVALVSALWRPNARPCNAPVARSTVPISLAGDGLHNLADGLLIGAGFAFDFSTGLALTIAIIIHETAQELGEFGILLAGTGEANAALRLNLLAALTVLPGAAIGFSIGSISGAWSTIALALANGSLLYLVLALLLPALIRAVDTRLTVRIAWFAVGCTWMFLTNQWHEHAENRAPHADTLTTFTTPIS